MAQRNRESSSGCFLCCRMWLENHTNEIKKSGLLKVTSSQFLSLLTLAFPYWLLVVIMTFSPLPLSLSHTHTYKMKTLTGTHQCIHTFSPTHMQTNSHNPPVNDEVSLLQGERGRDGDLGSPGVSVSVESFCFHWVAAELMFSNTVFKMCVSCVCAQLLELNVPTRTQGWDLHGANLGLHHEVTLN